ncbi:MAG: hypothetical protein H6557_33670 [Lewinellaceae bacterium]|nr:hypothetical protein [Phaeodactylibacter sp.]MCB9041589.1 hypothetical protein [Lewinellaceae bacterium]
MKIVNFNNKVLESWWALLKHLSVEAKLELASRLINSLKAPEPVEGGKNEDWKKLYGAWADDGESADKLIELIRESRFVNRKIESFD